MKNKYFMLIFEMKLKFVGVKNERNISRTDANEI